MTNILNEGDRQTDRQTDSRGDINKQIDIQINGQLLHTNPPTYTHTHTHTHVTSAENNELHRTHRLYLEYKRIT